VTRIANFRQRRIGKTFGSFASHIPLRTPSGPQDTESQLETELVIQLNFTPIVKDIITQPVIGYDRAGKLVEYAADILLTLCFWSIENACTYLIEVKRQDDLDRKKDDYAQKFAGAREWCILNGAEFRIMTEREIRTPYLHNARLLGRYIQQFPDHLHLEAILRLLRDGPRSTADLLPLLRAEGIEEPDARDAIEKAVANRDLGCDLSKKFDDDSLLDQGVVPPGTHPYDLDPITKLLRFAQGGSEQT
jgi:hypothetical protein